MKISLWVSVPLISIILFIAAWLCYPLFEKLINYQLNYLPLVVVEKSTPVKLKLLFSVTFAIIPLLTAMVNFLFQAKGKYNYYVYLSMLVSMIIFSQFRVYSVRKLIEEEQARFGEYIRIQFAVENLQIVSFMFIGTMLGCIVGALFLKRFQKLNKLR